MSSEIIFQRLPLHGSLQIISIQDFFKAAKLNFHRCFNAQFPNVVSIGQFKLLYTIGKGSFGTVKLVQKESDKKYYALKALDKRKLIEAKAVHYALNEKRMLQSVDFPFMMRLEYFGHDTSYIYLVMPFISGGELFAHLCKFRRFNESLTRFYAAQVVLALEYCQQLRIVHRDIKPENIVIDHLGFLKLTDFGFSKVVEYRTYTFCGTPPYIAPEIIQRVGYAHSVDWWSLGILIYEMNTGVPPFRAVDNMNLFIKISYGTYSTPRWFSKSLRSIVSKLLQRDVSRRLGNLKDGVNDVKNHEWFRPIHWMQLLNRKSTPPFVPPVTNPGDISNFPDSYESSELCIKQCDTDFDIYFKDF